MYNPRKRKLIFNDYWKKIQKMYKNVHYTEKWMKVGWIYGQNRSRRLLGRIVKERGNIGLPEHLVQPCVVRAHGWIQLLDRNQSIYWLLIIIDDMFIINETSSTFQNESPMIRTKKNEKVRWWTRPGLNRRPSPCKGDVITTRPRVRYSS